VIIKAINLADGYVVEQNVDLYTYVCGLNPDDVVIFVKKSRVDTWGTEQYWHSGNFDTCERFPVPQHSDVVEIYNDEFAYLYERGREGAFGDPPFTDYPYMTLTTVRALGALTIGGAYVELLGQDCTEPQCTYTVGDVWHTWVPNTHVLKIDTILVGYHTNPDGTATPIYERPSNAFKYAAGIGIAPDGTHYTYYTVPFANEWFNLCVLRGGKRICGAAPIWNGTVVYKSVAYAPHPVRDYLDKRRNYEGYFVP